MQTFFGISLVGLFFVTLAIRLGWRDWQWITGSSIVTILAAVWAGSKVVSFEEGMFFILLASVGGYAFPSLLRSAGTAAGRLLHRLAPWIFGTLLIIGVLKYLPERVGPLLGIGILCAAIAFMVKNFIPGGKKPERRRH